MIDLWKNDIDLKAAEPIWSSELTRGVALAVAQLKQSNLNKSSYIIC